MRPLFFFLHRKAELADVLAQAVVMTMAVAERFGRGQVEKTGLGVKIRRVGVDSQDLGDEQMVGPQLVPLGTDIRG